MSRIGLVADDSTSTVTVFDQETNTVLGSVSLPGGSIGDVFVLNDASLGFVTNFNGQLLVVDLADPSSPTLQSSIAISNHGEDITITPDNKYLVVSNGSAIQPLSVIDLSTLTEVSTFSIAGSDFNSVEMTDDGFLLTTSVNNDLVRKLAIDENGNITDTGLTLAVQNSNNVYVSPDGNFGVVVDRQGSISSFNVSDMSHIETVPSSDSYVLAGVFAPDGTTFYALTRNTVEAFSFNPSTGDLGDTPQFTFAVDSQSTFYGMDQIAITPDGQNLYVGENNGVGVYSTLDGTLVDTITNPTLVHSTGIALQSVNVITGTSGNDQLNGTQDPEIIKGLAGDDQINGNGGNDTLIGNGGNDTIAGGSLSDYLDGGAGNDLLYGNGGGDEIYGGGGRDGLYGSSAADYLNGGAGADTLYGNGGQDTLLGGGGADLIYGGSDGDYILGGNGADVIYANGGSDYINGGNGVDEVWLGSGEATVVLDANDNGYDIIKNFQLGQTLFEVSDIETLHFEDGIGGAQIFQDGNLLAEVSWQQASVFENNVSEIFVITS